MYFSTSKDLLFFVLAVSIGVISVFIVWAMVYVVLLLKKGYGAVRNVEKKLESVDALFNSVKEHLAGSSSSLKLLVEIASKLIGVVQNRRAAKAEKKKKA